MQLRVEGPAGASDWVVIAAARCSFGQVLAAIGILGAGAEVDGRWWSADAPFSATGAADGSVVRRAAGPAPAAPPTTATLVVTEGPDAGHRIALGAGRVTVGRQGADLCLRDPALSGRHARIDVSQSGTVHVEDLGSTNGTTVCDGTIRCGTSVAQFERTAAPPAPARRRPGPHHRPPRVPPPVAAGPIDVPASPAEPDRPRLGVATLAVPLATGVVLASMYGPRMAVIAIIGPFIALGGWLAARAASTRATRRAHRDHERALSELTARAAPLRGAEEDRRRAAFPGLLATVDRARSDDPRLWERRPAHDDFLQLSVGPGDLVWQIPSTREPDDAARAILSAAGVLRAVPITVDGRGLLGVCGPRPFTVGIARALVAQVVTLHGPADVPLAVFTSAAHAPDWTWTRWLPHLADPADGSRRFLATDATAAVDLAAAIVDDHAAAPYWLVVDGEDDALGRRGAVRALLAGGDGDRPGPRGVVLAEDPTHLPAACTTLVAVDRRGHVTVQSLVAAASRPIAAALVGLGPDVAESLARTLAPLTDPEQRTRAGRIPDGRALVAMLDVGAADATVTPQGIAARWATTTGTDELVVPIGVDERGVVEVDLVRDGPHALVAGTTGSGKSELLRTLVASLAASADTDHCNLVLVDFKGGAAFDRLTALPHVVGSVTDLDERLAARALRCLEAELRRRELVLREAGVSDITHYVRARRTTPALEPLPRLVVVIDEFATLVAELPEFVESLVDIAQRGRSLGVHLVLATQRPTGAVKESIRTNTNLRIALRVVEPSDSRDVVACDDAARLPRNRPGRAILRSGSSAPRAFQTAHVSGHTEADGSDDVTAWPWRLDGSRPGVEREEAGTGANDIDCLVDAVQRAHVAAGRATPRRPWPDALPTNVDAAALPPGSFALVDRPERQCVEAISWDPALGNLVVAGLTGSGVTTALRSLAVSLAATHTPDSLHLHVVGSDPTALADLATLSHCGGVLSSDDLERTVRLLRTLDDEMRRRRRAPVAGAPRIVALLDGVGSLRNELDETGLLDELDRLERLAADGAGVGIVFVFGADNPAAIGHRLERTAAQRLLLRLPDRSDYHTVGVHDVEPHALAPGRGFLGTGEEVQIARYDAAAVTALATTSHPEAIGRARPFSVGRLPEHLDAQAAGAHASYEGATLRLAFGIGDDRLETVGVAMRAGDHLLVTGPARSGKTTTLQTIAGLLRAGGVEAVDLGSNRHAVERPTAASLREVVDRLLRSAEPVVVLVDDADVFDDGGALLPLVQPGRPGLHVVAAARGDRLRGLFRHWTTELRRSRLGLLLRGDELDGDLLGARIPRRAVAPWRPGRGWLVTDDGIELCQVATTSPEDTPEPNRETDQCA
jgi:S-DNA-T family DNA segregation ATPase FtsK/SpoIIIE